MSELPTADPSSGRPRSLGQRTAALLIDLTLLGAIVYAGRVIALSVFLYVDDLSRHLLLGLSWSAGLDELREQAHSHPLLLGRPVLVTLLADYFGPAALLALYLAFVKEVMGDDSPGRMLLGRDGAWKRIKTGSGSVLGELAAKIRQSIRSWIPGQSPADLRQRVGKLGELFAPVRSLPEGSRAAGIAALGIAAVLAAATPAVISFDPRLAKFAFENAYAKQAFVPQVSVYLSLAALAVGWAAALAGAAATNFLAIAAAGPFYVFSFVFIGLTGGRSYWLALPQWTLPVLAAIAPSSARQWPLRLAVLWALCALAVFHTVRLTPLHALALSSWRVVLPGALVAAIAIGRLRRRVPPMVLFAALLAVNVSFLVAALRAGAIPVTANIYASLYQLAGLLTLFWFLLGANLVSACLSLTGSALAMAARFCSGRRLPWVAVGLCLAELFLIGELQRFNPAFMHEAGFTGQDSIKLFALPAHQGAAIAILVIAALLAAGGRLTAGSARALIALWAFSLFLVWTFFLSGIPLLSPAPGSAAHGSASIKQGFALLKQIEQRLGGEQQFAAIGLLTFSLFWEIFAGARPLRADGASSAQPSGALVLYTGALALLAALTHFSLLSGTMSAQAPDVFMYTGMEALWLPMALYAVFYAQQRVITCARNILLGSFLIGALAATGTCFQRVLLGDPIKLGLWPNLSVVAAGETTIFVCLLFIAGSPRIARAIDAAAAGAACALGFAVAYTQGLIAPILSQYIGVVAALTGFSSALSFVRSWLAPSRWNVVAQSDSLIFYLAAPASAGAIAVLIWKWKRREVSSWSFMAALLTAAATVLYTAPLYRDSIVRLPSSAVGAAAAAPAIYFGAIAYLAPLLLVFVLISTRSPGARP